MMSNGALLGLDLADTALDVCGGPIVLVHARHEERSVSEEVVHLLKRTPGSLWKETVEEDGVGQVTNLRIWLVQSPLKQGDFYLQRTTGRTSSQCSS